MTDKILNCFNEKYPVSEFGSCSAESEELRRSLKNKIEDLREANYSVETMQTVVIYEKFPRSGFLEKAYSDIANKLEKEGATPGVPQQLYCENAIIDRPKLRFQESGVYLKEDIDTATNVDNLLFGAVHYVVGIFGDGRNLLMILDPTSSQFNITTEVEVFTPCWLVLCRARN